MWRGGLGALRCTSCTAGRGSGGTDLPLAAWLLLPPLAPCRRQVRGEGGAAEPPDPAPAPGRHLGGCGGAQAQRRRPAGAGAEPVGAAPGEGLPALCRRVPARGASRHAPAVPRDAPPPSRAPPPLFRTPPRPRRWTAAATWCTARRRRWARASPSTPRPACCQTSTTHPRCAAAQPLHAAAPPLTLAHGRLASTRGFRAGREAPSRTSPNLPTSLPPSLPPIPTPRCCPSPRASWCATWWRMAGTSPPTRRMLRWR